MTGNQSQINPPVTGLTAKYFGTAGGATTRYYWIAANYSSGRSALAGPVSVVTIATLTNALAEVLISWSPAPGAISYDVLQTTTSAVPSTSAVGQAIGITQNSWTDIGKDTLGSYTPNYYGGLFKKIAHCKYDFTVDGGAISTITPANNFVLPLGAILWNVLINATTAPVGAGASISFGVTAGLASPTTALKAATAITAFTVDSLVAGIPVSTAATALKMSAAGQLTMSITAVALTAGVIEVFVEYYEADNA